MIYPILLIVLQYFICTKKKGFVRYIIPIIFTVSLIFMGVSSFAMFKFTEQSIFGDAITTIPGEFEMVFPGGPQSDFGVVFGGAIFVSFVVSSIPLIVTLIMAYVIKPVIKNPYTGYMPQEEIVDINIKDL